MPEITILVSPTGETKVEGHDFVGTACHDVISQYQQVLGTARAQQDHAETAKREVKLGGM